MLTSKRQNFHYSKLPKIGQIVTLPKTKIRAIVEAFPLCDNVLPWSIGIHTCYLRRLDTNQKVRFSGHYFAE